MLSRRDLLKLSAGGAALTMLPALLPGGSAFAEAGNAKLVVINLRGALDGLSAVPAVGDPDFNALRGGLIKEPPLPLTSLFALHPKLPFLHSLYGKGELVVFHSFASPYRQRSHFSGQDVLANGTVSEDGATGWLNRALYAAHGQDEHAYGISVGAVAPLLLRGPAIISSWSPGSGTEPGPLVLATLDDLYATDSGLAPVWAQALAGDRILGSSKADIRGKGLPVLTNVAGKFLSGSDLQVAVVECTGWDTHTRQQTRLASQLSLLDEALKTLAEGLGPRWSTTAVLVVTEFGRTVKVNGSGGTDHGTAAAAFLLGGAVQGGRVVADWRGLSQTALYEGRDLYPTGDLRSIFKGVLHDHLGVHDTRLEDVIFPDSRAAQPLSGLIRV